MGLEGKVVVENNAQISGRGSGIYFNCADLYWVAGGGLKEFGVNGEDAYMKLEGHTTHTFDMDFFT